jgi:hypothetical protein
MECRGIGLRASVQAEKADRELGRRTERGRTSAREPAAVGGGGGRRRAARLPADHAHRLAVAVKLQQGDAREARRVVEVDGLGVGLGVWGVR